MKRNSALALTLIIFLATLLRAYQLGTKSLWLDEGASVYYANVLIPSVVEKLVNGRYESLEQIIQVWNESEPGSPPFYYLLLRLWMVIGQDEFSIRLISALTGVLSVVVLYQLVKTTFNKRTALLSALLLAISPFHIDYSQNARMYPLITLLTLLAIYSTVNFLRSGRWIWRIGYVVCMVLSLYTHYISFFALGALNVIVIFIVGQKKDKKRLLDWLVMQCFVILLFTPWLPFLLHQARSNGNRPNAFVLPYKAPLQLFRDFSLGNYNWELPVWMIVAGLSGFLIFAIYGLLAAPPVRSSNIRLWGRPIGEGVFIALIYLGFAGLAALLLYSVRPYPTRVASFGLPAYYMLVAWGIDRARVRQRVKLVLLSTLTALLLFAAITNIYQRESLEDWRGAADYILRESGPKDVVLLHASFTKMPFDYYAAGYIPTTGLELVRNQPQLIPDTIQVTTQEYDRLWLVISHTKSIDPNGDVKLYMDRNYHLLEDKQFIDIEVYLYDL